MVGPLLTADARGIQIHRSGGNIGTARPAPDQFIGADANLGKSLDGFSAFTEYQFVRLDREYAVTGRSAGGKCRCPQVRKHDAGCAQICGFTLVVQASQPGARQSQGLQCRLALGIHAPNIHIAVEVESGVTC